MILAPLQDVQARLRPHSRNLQTSDQLLGQTAGYTGWARGRLVNHWPAQSTDTSVQLTLSTAGPSLRPLWTELHFFTTHIQNCKFQQPLKDIRLCQFKVSPKMGAEEIIRRNYSVFCEVSFIKHKLKVTWLYDWLTDSTLIDCNCKNWLITGECFNKQSENGKSYWQSPFMLTACPQHQWPTYHHLTLHLTAGLQ